MKYDKAHFDALGIDHEVVGNVLRVRLPEHHNAPIEVMIDGAGELDLVVDRSHLHRVIASKLGAPKPVLPDGMQ